jgi:putative ABC transport system permease protein
LLKNKTFSFINIIGLAIGAMCCIYILLYVQDQYSYDKHHKDVQDIYRVNTTLSLSGDKHNDATSSPPIAPALKADFPEVQQYARVVTTIGVNRHLLTYKEKSFYEKDMFYVDSTFFDIFSYHFVKGSPQNALTEPYSIVLFKAVADKLFAADEPIGKSISIDNGYGKHDFKVTGVIDESLGKTHIKASMFVTMHSGGIGDYVLRNQIWAGNNFANAYVKLRPGASAAALEAKIPAFLVKHGEQQLKDLGMQKILHLQPVSSIHTTPGLEIEQSKTVSPSFLYILLIIGIMIQVIACINFMNLSTARASKRAKEVGVRKVIGAGKSDLIKQFLGESFLLSFAGVLLALPLLLMVMPYLNNLTGVVISWAFLGDYRIWLMLAGIILVTGFIAGSYPAFYLSAFQAVKVIKGNFTTHVSAAGIRRSLVVFQFVMAVVLISVIIIIYSQLSYIKNRDLGFNQNQKLVFGFYTNDTQGKMKDFANDLRHMADVKAVTKADNYLGQFIGHDHTVFLQGGNMATGTDAQNIATDEFFVKTHGIHLLNGRDFRPGDTNKVLINQTLAKRLGLDPEKAVGTRLYSEYKPRPATFVEVAGVMKDFNYNSLHIEVRPFMLVYTNDNTQFVNMVASVSSTDYKQLLGKIEAVWHKDVPSAPFDYAFLDSEVQKQYETEVTLSQIINLFTLIAIFVSCLGLFGLAAFSAEQRNKEIGIRKVLGASVTGIVQLLSMDFLKLVFISIIIATPIAWYAMNKWLQDFVYRVNISWWMFVLAGAIAIIIAFVTVSFQSVKAAIANPIKSLRSE